MDDTARPTDGAGWRRVLPPWWTALFPLAVMLGVAGWRAAAAESGWAHAFVAGAFWPGLGVAGAVAAMVWLGWVLDID